ncbi:hypothetical protein [Clostridium saccharobutylicum]|uniref:Cell adhesion domain-containing protein n=1 Tax=Clostridium saccharobutylicum DSM 13864 TaxID=1345695 RepID=U5MPP7_CLOSA|nr:hypothetical protein [Clostridium saccharobutylicum]AGX42478.1 cell adhesion domain-containing protein [Clostridium saccharobutylicum DSM 13864]AQR89763.1 hypothetical protein CLOSC_14660 [Clostridium saccharobutylicum]AQR99665.1 hypothetical protein CSACC_14740 [Clostridium saccharobutylicum]AQS09396.1 hypothetical protein CLOBY_15230 [Clostridium saccharobutylicum]AQS13651.1 hypothetical protein CLOSACC_14740 [Clostridium saccharobutylicum]
MKTKVCKICVFFIACFSIFLINGIQAKAADLTPDYGIYWYGKGNVSEKFVPGQSNRYFDPTKPTIIYVHGWQKDSQPNNKRESFNFKDENGNVVNGADAWIDKGWNIGIFYWDMFSDEFSVTDAEAKIWSNNGPQKMRWRDHSGNYHYSDYKNAGELFYDTYVQAMKNYKGNNIRIAGHSLGNQMATYLTKRVYDAADAGQISKNLKPSRLALLDPYWSNGGKSYLNNKWTGEACREYVKDLKSKGTAIELYRSTYIDETPAGDNNKGELDQTAFVHLNAWFKNSFDIAGKHNAAVSIYFTSYSSPAPALYNRDGYKKYSKIAGNGPSAASSDSEIKNFMNSNYRYDQYTGVYTLSSKDNGFAQMDRNTNVYVVPIN